MPMMPPKRVKPLARMPGSAPGQPQMRRPTRPAGPARPQMAQPVAKPAPPQMGGGGGAMIPTGIPPRPKPMMGQNPGMGALAGQRFLPPQAAQQAQANRARNIQQAVMQRGMPPAPPQPMVDPVQMEQPPLESLMPQMGGPDMMPPQMGMMGAPEMQEMGGNLRDILANRKMQWME